MKLDIDFVRNQFNQIRDNPDFVFCSNAGGSYMANQVNSLMNHYNTHTRVQPYERYEVSCQAGIAMDRAIDGWAEALGILPSELTIGPSTSINTYVMAQALGSSLNDGDEIVVTNQDHEANSGVWRRKAVERNVKIREWRVDTETGLLDTISLMELLNDNTKWVFFPHCSNIVGTSNSVEHITKIIKQNCSANVFVDAVAQAPHQICNLKNMGVMGYAFSLYKVFGPHQSLMYINSDVVGMLDPQCHYFNRNQQSKLFNPAGPQHAQVASCAGVLDYFNDLHRHHFGSVSDSTDPTAKMSDLYSLISNHESQLIEPILSFLDNNNKVQLIGKAHTKDGDRAPTIAFKPLNQSSLEVSSKMQKLGIGCESGDFYAHRLLSDMGIDADDGVVRISLVHYSNEDEVSKILSALDESLNY